MARVRSILGLLAVLVIFLSSFAHTILGWKSLEPRITATGAPADLVVGLRIGWQWGGVAMLGFALICGAIFVQRLRGQNVSAFPAVVTGVLYIAFGVFALELSGNPFFAVFIVPGVLLLLASMPNSRRDHANNHAG